MAAATRMELEEEEEGEVEETIKTDKLHPLMMEDVLDKVFPYFTDKQNLTSFRLVNTTWNKAVCRSIKENLRWTIGEGMGKNEFRFAQCMSSCKDDLFRKFRISQSQYTLHVIQQFLMAHGTSLIDLDLRASSNFYNKSYLKPDFLPNLQRLRLFDLTDETLGSNCCRFFKDNLVVFPKLQHIRFDQRDPNKLFLYHKVHEDSSAFCINLLRAAPACTTLDINLQKTTIKLLDSPDPDLILLLGSLTSFNTLLGPGSPHVFLDLTEFKALTAKCPKLVKLSTSIIVFVLLDKCICQTPEEDIYKELASLAPELQELNLELYTVRRHNEFADHAPPPHGIQAHHGDEEMDIDQNVEANVKVLVCHATRRRRTHGYEDDNVDSDNDEDDSNSNHENKSNDETEESRQHGVKRNHEAALNDNNSMEDDGETNPPKKIRAHRTLLFPYFPKLKKLGLKHFHLSNNFDIFNNMPALTHVDIDLKPCNPLEWPIIEPSTGNPSIKYLRFRGDKYDHMEHKLALFADAFPALIELDVVVPCNCALSAIFMYMPRLKRLHLNSSEISDAGFTGMRSVDPKEAHLIDWGQKEPTEWREHPYIGNLVDLQHLTYTRAGVLTHFSVDHGIVDCKNLTYLKLPAYEERPREAFYAEPYYNYDNCPSRSLRAQICPILSSCPRLVKLDVSSKNIGSSYKKIELNSLSSSSSRPTKYTVNEDDVEFVKVQSQFPYFQEILYDKN